MKEARNTKRGILAMVLCIALVATNALSFQTAAVNTYSVDTPYTYPVVPGTDAWAALETRVDMAEACMIPEELLSEMTTSALLETVLNYPLLADVMAYDSGDTGVERVARSFNGLQELLNRSDLQVALDDFSLEDSYIADEPKAYKMVVAEMVLSILQRLGQTSFQVNTRSALNYDYVVTTVMTPTADLVPAYQNMSYYDHGYSRSLTESEIITKIEEIEAACEDQYSAERLTSYAHNPSCNCHCFALYGEGELENYWINDPKYYYFGSAYFGVDNGQPASLYEVPESNTLYPHFALYYDPELSPSEASYYTHTAIRIGENNYYSKWGMFGVFRHTKTLNPYYVVDDEVAYQVTQMAVSYWRWDYNAIED